jgi:hypothetical protein
MYCLPLMTLVLSFVVGAAAAQGAASPNAKSFNETTQANWERIGVEPDVKVDAGDTFATAYRLAREQLSRPAN